MKVSVALCSYNGERYIKDQIYSILNQTHTPDEIVVCDDCSTDNTVGIIKEIIEKSEVVFRIVENEANIGFVRNFQKCISLASGDIVFLSDQDDVWFENKIEVLLQCFEEDAQIGLVYSDAIVTDSRLNPSNQTLFSIRPSAALTKGKRKAIHEIVTKGIMIKGCTIACRASIIQHAFPMPLLALENSWGHDHWLIQIAYAVSKVNSYNKPLLYYRRHDENAGQDKALSNQKEMKSVPSCGIKALRNDILKLSRMKIMSYYLSELEHNLCSSQDKIHMLTSLKMEYSYLAHINRIRPFLRDFPFHVRIAGGLWLLISGGYHKYYSGLMSFARDIISEDMYLALKKFRKIF